MKALFNFKIISLAIDILIVLSVTSASYCDVLYQPFLSLALPENSIVKYTPFNQQFIQFYSKEKIELRDIPSGNVTRVFQKPAEESVSKISFSRNGKYMLALCGKYAVPYSLEYAAIHIWDFRTGDLVQTFIPQLGTRTVSFLCGAFSHDDLTIAVGNRNGVILLYDMRTGELLGSFSADPIPERWIPPGEQIPPPAVSSIEFSKDGTTLLASYADDTVRLWDVRTKQMLQYYLYPYLTIPSLASFLSDIKEIIVYTGKGDLDLLDPSTFEKIRTVGNYYEISTGSPLLSPDKKLLTIHTRRDAPNYRTVSLLKIIDVDSGAVIREIIYPKELDDNWDGNTPTPALTYASISPDGKTIMTATNQSSVLFWDVGDLISGIESAELLK